MSESTIINQRIDALPPKVATPFRALLQAGQLGEDSASIILDAGELTGEHGKLLGFAIAYHHLRAQGTPVHDVIRMAKAQKRRINLSWSEKRWKTEHERLSRAETLRRLTADNVPYDVSKFETHLPERFDGYLIRSSRRLGMEGLRQRHCVASYHSQLASGSCAIAAVFVDGRRWTVQLHMTDNAEHPIRISQIKTRYNGLPPPEVRQRIYETLGLETEPKPASSVCDQDGTPSYLSTLQQILPILRQYNVPSVTVNFDGGGDDGSIDYISFGGTEHSGLATLEVNYPQTERYFDEGQWRVRTHPVRQTLHRAIEDLSYDYIEQTDVDWYNNDGGFGELEIDVIDGTVKLSIDVRYTESTNEFWEERDIMTGEEL